MADARHTTPTAHTATESIDSDLEHQIDDLDDLDDDDCFEPLDDFGLLDELEQLGGFSQSTSVDDPPPE
jgi:hypothetical protein